MLLRDLRYFCLTAELEHVSKAAKQLGVSQPFLSKIISQLENEIGTQLFDHVGRSIKLNYYGEIFYKRSKGILAEIDTLFEEMDGMLEKRERTITFVSDTAGYTSDIMLAYKTIFPNSIIRITYDKRDNIIEALNTGNIDFALCTPPITQSESELIETVIVFEERGCIILPPGSPLIGKESLDLNDLQDQPLVTSPLGAGVRNNLELNFQKYNYTPNIVCESNDMELLIKAVLGGLGFAFMPHRMMKDHRLKPYCAEINLPNSIVKIGLSYNKGKSSNKSTMVFQDFIMGVFDDIRKNS